MFLRAPLQSFNFLSKRTSKRKCSLFANGAYVLDNRLRSSSKIFCPAHKYQFSAVSIKDMKIAFDPTKKTEIISLN